MGALSKTMCCNISTVRSICSNKNFLHAGINTYSTLFVFRQSHKVKLVALCQPTWLTALWSQPQIVYYLIDLITEKKINQR